MEILLRHTLTNAPESFWAKLPLGRDVQIVARDPNGLVAFAKPAGVLSHPNVARDEPRSLLVAHYDTVGEFFHWPAVEGRAAGKLWLVNRLDSATSGLLLAASSEKLAQEIRASFQRRHIKKIYNALVFGAPHTAKDIWRDRLSVDKRGGQIRTATTGHVPSEAHVHVLQTQRGARVLSLIELEPKTGRSHQLRVQCTKRHLPIVGDATYGDFKANRDFAKATGEKRLFLHSLHTEFEYTLDGRICRFSATAPLPEEFLKTF